MADDFEPDDFEPEVPTGKVESAARGAAQGLSLGWGDELSASLAAALPFLDREATGNKDTLASRYVAARNFYRNRNTAAERENPGTYLTGQVVGGVAPMFTGTGAANAAGQSGVKLLLKAAGQGAAAGAGYSEANDARGLLRDTSLGTGLGVAGYGLGRAAGAGYEAVRRRAVGMAGRATAKAAHEGAEAATAPVRSIEASARERAANAYRQMERINNALADKSLPPAERAALEAFKQSPEYAELLVANAKGILGAAPDAAAELAAARQIAAQARAALPAEIQRETAARLLPTPKADTKSFLKSYAEPLVWGGLGIGAGKAMGLDPDTQAALGVVAGAIGGRTRAGKALLTRVRRPGNQLLISRGMQSTADTLDPLTRALLQRAAPAALASSLATNEEP
jgi:hypothetical protein